MFHRLYNEKKIDNKDSDINNYNINNFLYYFIYSVIKSDIEYRSRLANISYTIKNNKTKKDIEDKNTQLMLEFKYIQNKSHLTNLKCI